MKFKNTSPKEDVGATSIKTSSKNVIAKVMIIGVVIGFVGFNLYTIGTRLYVANDAMQFAYNHPEMVNPLKDQYNEEFQSLQDSFAKRQAIVATEAASPKE